MLVLHTVYGDDNDLLRDYQLLYIDLLNIKTWGYKSFYNTDSNRSGESINISQGSLQMTGNNFDCAIVGEGFFKIRLENNRIAYTRNGAFKTDPDGVMVTPQGYPLYESICPGKSFLPESFTITRDHDVYAAETNLGKLLTYKIPGEYLEYYKDAIYTIKDNADYKEEVTFDNFIIQGALESSNYDLLPVIVRMYYILSVLDKNMMPNIEFKKELLKIQILRLSATEERPGDYLESILPFIKWDY
jgi:flagellar basal body rod protein FlgG